MTAHDNGNGFRDKGPELVAELRERTAQLKESGAVVEGISQLIDESENLLHGGKVSESKNLYLAARGKIETVEVSIASQPLAWKLFRTEIGYLAILLFTGYVTYKWPHFFLWDGFMEDPIAMHLQTVWFGALGGVTIAIYGIYEHVQLRDFDPRYELWYICKPLIGGIFGWFVYLIYFIGLVSVQGVTTKIHTPELPYVISFLAGFSERFTLKMIDKLMGVLTTWEEKKGAAAPGKDRTKTV